MVAKSRVLLRLFNVYVCGCMKGVINFIGNISIIIEMNIDTLVQYIFL